MTKLITLSLTLLCITAAYSNQASASLISPDINNTNCSAVTLTSVSALNDVNTNLLSNSYNASQCIGFIGPNPSHNDDPFQKNTTNVGYLGDGLLNGSTHNGVQYFTGTEFITSSDLLDLQTPDTFVDPGWIHLGQTQGINNWDYSLLGDGLTKDGSPVSPLNIADLLELNFACDSGSPDNCKAGQWTLTTKLNIIEDVQALLGPATFDHLAISIKAGPSFVVYDFNFKDIFNLEGNPLLNFSTPYVFKGTFNTSDMGNKGVSHLNVLARDPLDNSTFQVPAPATIAIMGLGLLVLRLFRR